MVAFILPANSASSGGYTIDNSLRFEANSHKLTRTYGTPTSQRIFTFSVWVKRSNFSAHNYLIGQNDTNEGYIRFTGPDGDRLNLEDRDSGTGSSDFSFQTSMLFRDPSAWYHIVVAFDTTQSTDTNRRKVYVNGVQQTSFSASTIAPQNYDMQLNQSGPFQIGSTFGDLGAYLSDYYFIDGQQKAASVFGEFNDNGVWIPKDPTDVKENVTFGDNGFLLEFKETGTSANSSGMGADTSGEDNHWAATNLAATDVTTDTPTNNFATLNALAVTNSDSVLTEGNTVHTVTNGNAWIGAYTTIGAANGKWYAEVKILDVDNTSFGIIQSGGDTVANINSDNSGYIGKYADGWGWWGNGSAAELVHNNSNTSYGSAESVNDIFMIAVDIDGGKFWIGKNGTWFNAPGTSNVGDPANGNNPGFSSITFTDFVHFASGNEAADSDDAAVGWNFGNAAHSISSGNADANGYGNFEYAVPSGYYSLCTKNLADYG